MARRRLNTRFLIALLSVLFVVAVGLGVVKRYVLREKPDRYIAAGTQAAHAGQWQDAVDNFTRAVALAPNDADLMVTLGDIEHSAILAGAVDQTGKDVRAWELALQINPNHAKALHRLCEYYEQYARRGEAAAYTRLREYAQRLHQVEPEDTQAEAMLYLSTVEGWLNGVTTEDKAVESALSDLRQLMARDSTNPYLPYYLAAAKMKRASDLSARTPVAATQPAAVTSLFAEAAATFDEPLKSHDSASMRYLSAQTFDRLAALDRSSPAARAAYQKRAQDDTDRAVALAKVDDPLYTAIYLASANRSMRTDRPRAEKVLRDLVAAKPRDLTARLGLAQFLGGKPETRAEAIGILEQSLANAPPGALAVDGLRYQSLVLLTDLRLNDYQDATDPAERDRILAQVNAGIARLREARGDAPEIVHLAGRALMEQGKTVEAITQLSRAVDGSPQVANDVNVLRLLADAYDRQNQSGKAIEFARRILQRNPDQPEVQLFLCKLLLQEDPAGARKLLDGIERQRPDDPQVLVLRLATLDVAKEPEKARGYFDRLPEEKVGQMLQKAQIAQQLLKDPTEAERLYLAALAKEPAEVRASFALAQLYYTTGRSAQAADVVAKARAAHPDNPQLPLLAAQVANDSPDKILEVRRQIIAQMPDPLTRELNYADLAAQLNDAAGLERHLKAAEAVAPKDPRVCDSLFTLYLRLHRFDDAAAYLDRLADNDRDQTGGLLYRYRLDRAKGDLQGALDVARQMTQQYGDFSAAWLTYGEALQNLGKFDAAIEQYTVALQKQSNNPNVLKAMVDCYYAANKPDDALRQIQKGRDRYPDDTGFRDLMIQHQLNYGKPSDALALLKDETARRPDEPALQAALGQTYLRVAHEQETAGNHDAAQAAMAGARDVLSKGSARWPDVPEFYLAMSEAALLSGNVKGAEQCIVDWAARPAWNGRREPYLRLADFYKRVGAPDAAEAAYRAALDKSKNAPEVQLLLAAFLAERQRPDDAMAVLTKTNADDPRIRRGRIELMLEAHHVPDAIKVIEDALAHNAADAADLHALYAKILLDQDKLDAVLDQTAAALRVDPAHPLALLYQAQARLRRKPADPDKALADLTIARQNAPANADVRIAIAQAYLAKNDQDHACEELVAALKLDPANKSVRMFLVRVYATAKRYGEAMQLLTDVAKVPPYDRDPDVAEAQASIYQARGDYDAALAASLEAQRRSPENVNYYREYLSIMLAAGQPQALLDATDKLPDKRKEAWWVYQSRGMAQKQLGNADAAMAEFDKGLSLAAAGRDESATNALLQTIAREVGVDQAIQAVADRAADDFAARLTLAVLYHNKGDDVRAVQTMKGILAGLDKLAPSDKIAALRTAGRVYATAKPQPMIRETYDVYKQLLAISPDDVPALNNLACLLVDNFNPPRPAEGLQYAQHAVDVMSQAGQIEPLVLDTQGWLLILNGQAEKGVPILQDVIARRAFPDAYYHLGEGYLRLRLVQEAQKQVALAQDLITQMQASNQPVDPLLKQKVIDLNARCGAELKTKADANAP